MPVLAINVYPAPLISIIGDSRGLKNFVENDARSVGQSPLLKSHHRAASAILGESRRVHVRGEIRG